MSSYAIRADYTPCNCPASLLAIVLQSAHYAIKWLSQGLLPRGTNIITMHAG